MTAPMIVEEGTFRAIDIPHGTSRTTLRIVLTEAGKDSPATLILCSGFGGAETGSPFHRPSFMESPTKVPAEILPQLIEALQKLQGGGS